MSKSRNCNFQRNPPVEITTNVKLFLSLRCKVSGQNGLSPREDDRQRYDRETRVRAHGERFHLTPRTLAGCSLLLQLIARTKEKIKKRKGKKRLFAFEEAGNYGSHAYSCKHTRARTHGWLPLSCGKKAVQGWLKKEGPYGRQRPAPLCVGAPSLSHALFSPLRPFYAQHLPAYTCTQCDASFDPLSSRITISIDGNRQARQTTSPMRHSRLFSLDQCLQLLLRWIDIDRRIIRLFND